MADDDDLFGDEDQTEVEDNKTIRQMREAIERLEKKLSKAEEEKAKAVEKAREEARAQMEREAKAAEVAGSLGNPKLANLYLRLNPEGEVTEEAIRGFAEDYGFPVKAKEEEGEAVEEKKAPPTESVPQEVAKFHATGAGTGVSEKLWTAPEMMRAYAAGELSAEQFTQIIAEGKMRKETDPEVLAQSPEATMRGYDEV